MAIFSRGNHTDSQAAGPESSKGGPVYDATIHPAYAGEIGVGNERLQQQRDLHLFYGKSAAAESFSHFREGTPSPVTVRMMGLSAQRDTILAAQDRTWELPFPGVPLGAVPAFAASPYTGPVVGHPTLGKTHHAHQVESKRATRLRFRR